MTHRIASLRRASWVRAACPLALASGVVASTWAQQLPRAPDYAVEASWPRALPNNWLIGQIGGLAVDKRDHIWVYQRPRSLTDDEKGAVPNAPLRTALRSRCCRPGPSVMEFDADGNLLQAWGGPEDPDKCVAPACGWPASEHAIFVDDADHVWLAGNGPTDRMVLEFTREGRFVRMIGGSFAGPADSRSTTSVGRAAGIFVDASRNEVYVADGYLNGRVVKFTATTGAFITAWGAYGNPPTELGEAGEAAGRNGVLSPEPPDPLSRHFNRPVHCVVVARDGLVYVCDRANNRIQIFTRDGGFRGQFVFDPETRGNGAVWSIALSPDSAQRLLIYADGENNLIRILNRASGEVLRTFGSAGRNAGQFHWLHQVAVDSHGNLYTGEVDTGKRLQKFVPRK
ncbi:MAG TPA: hypothetical protein VM736_01820 [Gemmatimonadales bacterium]|nr:hypothetical protein [Gemmatimonadales bacterium]